MSFKDLDIFKLEDRVLFDAAGAAEVMEAAEAAHDDPNANVNETEQQAQDEKSAEVKNAPPENPADRAANEPEETQIDPADNADVNVLLDAILNGDLPDTGADIAADNPVTLDTINSVDTLDSSENDMVDVLLNDGGEAISTDRELVVINGTVPDKEAILAELKPNQDVLVLEDGNGLDELNGYLDDHADVKYSAIHLVTHGGDGKLSVNGEKITAETFDAEEWAQIGEHLTDDGDILLYGCDTAKSAGGQALVDKIADASGADVAASTDTTGLHGNWDLEYTSDAVKTASIQIDGYAHDLAAEQTITVDSSLDVEADDGVTTLREAVNTANSGGSDVDYLIVFDIKSGDLQIDLGSTLSINHNLTIDGANTAAGYTGNIILDGGHTAGNPGVRIMEISFGRLVKLSNLTFQNGYTTNNGGALHNAEYGTLIIMNSIFKSNAANKGGAIYNEGYLSLDNTSFSGNTADNGGAVYSAGSSPLLVTGSSFMANQARNGGAISLDVAADSGVVAITIDSSYFTGNTASGNGGAIYSDNSVNGSTLDVAIINSVIHSNTANGGGGIYNNGANAKISVVNSTVSLNTAGAAADGTQIVNAKGDLYLINDIVVGTAGTNNKEILNGNSGSLYLYSTVTGGIASDGTLTQWGQTTGAKAEDIFVSTAAGQTDLAIKTSGAAAINGTLAGNILVISPDMGSGDFYYLRNNTWYKAGDDTVTITFDPADADGNYGLGDSNEPGVARKAYTEALDADEYGSPVSRCLAMDYNIYNAGAYAINSVEAPGIIVTTAQDVVNPFDNLISLREAIVNAETNGLGSDITFDRTVFAAIQTITLNSTLGTLNIDRDLTIDGAGKVILDGGNSVQIMNIAEGKTVTLSNLTFQNGAADHGGAIYSKGNLTVVNSTFSGNTASNKYESGGAVFNSYPGVLTVVDSTFSGNTGIMGADVYTKSTAYIVNTMLLDGSISDGDLNLMYCVYKSVMGGRGSVSETHCISGKTVADVMESTTLDADGTFHIKADGRAADSGTLAAKHNTDGTYYFKDGNTWKLVADQNTTADESALTVIDKDQLGTSRLGTAATYGIYAAGASFVNAAPETASTVVTTTEDVVNPYDGLISFREAAEVYSTAGDTITFTTGNGTQVFNSAIILNKNISIGDDFDISISGGDDRVIFNVSNGAVLTFNNVTLGDGVINGPDSATFAVATGKTLTVGSLTVYCGRFDNKGTLNVSGALILPAAVSNYGSVVYSGGNQTILAGTYDDLSLRGSGVKTLNGDISAKSIAVTGSNEGGVSVVALNGKDKNISIVDGGSLSARYATINRAHFAEASVVDSWDNTSTNTVDGSGNTNLTINLGGDFSASLGDNLTYGETLKDDASIIVTYSLRGQNATLSGSTDDATLYNAGSRVENVAVAAAGYSFAGNSTFDASLAFTVSPKEVAVMWSVAAGYTYNGLDQGGTVSAKFTGLHGFVDLAVSFSGEDTTFKNAGSYTATASMTTADGNYSLVGANRAFTVNKLVLTHNVTPNASKVYDGNTSAAFTGGLTNVFSGDLVELNAKFAYNDKDVNDATTISATAWSISGADSGNYELAGFTPVAGSITAKALTVTANVQTITYGESPNNLSDYDVSGWVSGERESLGDMRVTGTRSVGGFLTAGTPHEFDGSTLASTSGNYKIDFTTAALTVNKLVLTHDVSVAASKVYDGTTNAGYTGGLTNVAAGDKVMLNAAFEYADKHVGTGKSISTLMWDIIGDDVANYELAPLTGLTADITPMALAITVNDQADVVYGTVVAPDYTHTGLAEGDRFIGSLAVTGAKSGSGNWVVGSHDIVRGTLEVEDGNGGGNYTLVFTGGSFSVGKLTLTHNITFDITKKFDGNDKVNNVSGGLSNVIAGDEVVMYKDFRYSHPNVSGVSNFIYPYDFRIIDEDSGNYELPRPGPVYGIITPKTVDAVWNDSAPYYYTGKDQGGTISAYFIDVNGLDVKMIVAFAGKGEIFKDAGEYQANVAAGSKNYRISDGTQTKSYVMLPGVLQTATYKPEWDSNFDATIPAILGNALANGAATSPTEGNLYTAPYSTLISATEINQAKPDTKDGNIYVVSPERGNNSLLGKNRMEMTSDNISTTLSSGIVGIGKIVNAEGFASGNEIVRKCAGEHQLIQGGVHEERLYNILFESNVLQLGSNGLSESSDFIFQKPLFKMPRAFFLDDTPEENATVPGYDLAGLPEINLPRKNDMFKSDFERLLDEMLVTA